MNFLISLILLLGLCYLVPDLIPHVAFGLVFFGLCCLLGYALEGIQNFMKRDIQKDMEEDHRAQHGERENKEFEEVMGDL